MINGVKCGLLIAGLLLTACQPLLDDVLDRGTELVAGDYAPKDHWSGQWRVINIWAEWCKPCWQEIPELNQFYAAQGNKDILLLGFNFDELEKAELIVLKEKMSIQFPLLTQWPNEWEMPDIKGLPATLIVSPNNEIVKTLWGPQSLASLYDGLESAKRATAARE